MLLIKVPITHTRAGTGTPPLTLTSPYPPTFTLKSAANAKVIMQTICSPAGGSGVDWTGLISL